MEVYVDDILVKKIQAHVKKKKKNIQDASLKFKTKIGIARGVNAGGY